ncbi:MAG: thioredoxin family protein [Balneolaceae bacterium]|nr:MAG: thioredoxin family protein [Balneolaceae bacterium]
MTEVKAVQITRDLIENAYNYREYREMIDQALSEGKTTGENHSEAMLHYTKMNVHRMSRLDRRTELLDELKKVAGSIGKHQTWLVITEAWCGDAAQSLPVIQKIADESSAIHAKYILRDENLEIMDQFLTNGKSRSVPKLVCLDSKTLDVLGTWGPRPEAAQKVYDEWREEDLPYQQIAEKLHKWYAEDRTESIQTEFIALLQRWSLN